MSAVSSAISTLALEGYSLTIPDWAVKFLVLLLLIYIVFTCCRLIKTFIESVKVRKEN